MINNQIEFSLNNSQPPCPSVRRVRRAERARWWFARMREVVEAATEWTPAPPARPEQIRLPFSSQN